MASRLGGRSVAEWKQVIGCREFGKWQAYEALEWQEHTKPEYYMAQLAALIASVWGGAEHAKPEDFLMQLKRPPSNDDMLLYDHGD